MMEKDAGRVIQVGDQIVELPPGVSLAEWSLEKSRRQNPRIRALLGCNHLLEEVLDSNYAILHCSPERLLEIWRRVHRVADTLRADIPPLLEERSPIPALEEARQSAKAALELLEKTVLKDLDSYATDLPSERMVAFRKLLCVTIGKLHAFLQDTFGEFMAADPRSQRDADYFLSRRFPRDIEEAEWLYASVDGLERYLRTLGQLPYRQLSLLADRLRKDGTLPSHEEWKDVQRVFRLAVDELTPMINEILALRGIRFSEMEVLDRYTRELPVRCTLLLSLYDTGREALEQAGEGREPSGAGGGVPSETAGGKVWQQVISRRLARLITEVNSSLMDLRTFVPIWLRHIERRRALMLSKPPSPETLAS